MNWLAWDTRSYGGALVGGLLGFLVFKLTLEAGSFQPWMIGVGMGLGCALLTKERSTMRGLVLGCAAAWGGAVAQVALLPVPPDAGILDGIRGFSETLTLATSALHLAGIVGAYLFGRMAFRRDASQRVAGAGRKALE